MEIKAANNFYFMGDFLQSFEWKRPEFLQLKYDTWPYKQITPRTSSPHILSRTMVQYSGH
jgi:hypothetical protein